MRLTLERESKTPLYLQLTEKLRERIAVGDWKPGERLPTYKGMAEQLGVSKITVNQAMDMLVLEGWVVRAQGSGTYVADPAKIKSGLRRTAIDQNAAPVAALNIGVFALQRDAPDWEWTDFYHEPLRLAIHEEVSSSGGRVIPQPIAWNFLESALENGADGLLLSQVEPDKHDRLAQLTEAGIPYVIVGASYEDRTLPCVAVDNANGMAQAVRHLVDLGHRRIAFVCLDLDNPDHQERWQAFQKTMSELGIALDLRLLLLHGRVAMYDDVMRTVRNWLDGGLPPFTAIIACSCLEGMGTMRALLERGYRVPEDMSLVSFDDSSAAALHNPPMTVVRQPVQELGHRSVEKLIAGIQTGQMPEGTEILPTQLIVRESTRAITS